MTTRGRPRKPTPKRTNGAGTYYVDERGKHVVQGTVPGVGRRKVRADSELEAWTAFAQLKADTERFDLTTKIETVGQLAGAWLNNYDRGHAEASTRSVRVQRVRHHIVEDQSIAARRARDIQPSDIEAWLLRKIHHGYRNGAGKRRGYAPSTITQFRHDVTQVLAWGVNRRVLDWNPAKHIDTFRVEESTEPKRTLTPDQASRLIHGCLGSERRYAVYVLAMLLLGARPGEVAGLAWDRIDFEAGTITIDQALKRRSGGIAIGLGPTKTKTQRVLVAPGILLDALAMEAKRQNECRHPEWPSKWAGLVFLGRLGTPPLGANLRRSLRQIVADAGLSEVADLDPYELRHTCASLLDDAGIPVSEIINQLGHADDRMFYKHYRHKVDPITGKAAVAAWEAILGGS